MIFLNYHLLLNLNMYLTIVTFNLLSNVRLLGSCKTDNSTCYLHILLYGRSIERKWCSDLFEFSRNHIFIIKLLITTIGEYTNGLPRCLLMWLEYQSVNPTNYKMLIWMDDELIIASLFDSICYSSEYDTL
jgi:hypothetical protein